LGNVTVFFFFSAGHGISWVLFLSRETLRFCCVIFKKKKKKHVDVISMVHR